MQVFFVHSFRAYFVQVFFLAWLLLCFEANSSKRVGNLETKIWIFFPHQLLVADQEDYN